MGLVGFRLPALLLFRFLLSVMRGMSHDRRRRITTEKAEKYELLKNNNNSLDCSGLAY